MEKGIGLLKKSLNVLNEEESRKKEIKGSSVFISNARLVDRDMDAPGALMVYFGIIVDVYTGANMAAAQVAAKAATEAGIEVVRADGLILTPSFINMRGHLDAQQKKADENVSSAELLSAMKECAAAGLIFSCSGKDEKLAEDALRLIRCGFATEGRRLLRLAENINTERNLLLAEKVRCRIHIENASSKAALECIRDAKAERSGFVTCGTDARNLLPSGFSGADAGSPYMPEEERLALLEGLKDGTIDVLGADFMPSTDASRFLAANATFSTCYTELAKTGIVSLQRLFDLMSSSPASILSLPQGLLKTGFKADLMLLDGDAPFSACPDDLSSEAAPMERQLYGKIKAVWENGCRVFQA